VENRIGSSVALFVGRALAELELDHLRALG